MANTPNVGLRVELDMIERARAAYGLADASTSTVLRYCLALAVGHPDPLGAARIPLGRRPMPVARRERERVAS